MNEAKEPSKAYKAGYRAARLKVGHGLRWEGMTEYEYRDYWRGHEARVVDEYWNALWNYRWIVTR